MRKSAPSEFFVDAPDRSRSLSSKVRAPLFGKGGTLARVLDEYEAREEQADLADAVARALANGSTCSRRPAPGRARASPTSCPRSRRGARRRRDGDEGAPGAAADEGRAARGRRARPRRERRRAQGQAELPVPQPAAGIRAPRRVALRDGPKTAVRSSRCGRGSTRPRPATGPSSRSSRPQALWSELAVGSDRCLGRTCAFVGTCFSEAARERASHADLVIANHALYFADLGSASGATARRAARARRGRLRRGAPARGDGGDLARRPRLGAPACTGSRATSTAPAARRACRRLRGALDRVERAGAELLRRGLSRRRPASGSAQPAGGDLPGARRAARPSCRRHSRARTTSSTRSAGRALGMVARRRGLPRSRRARARRLGGAGRRRVGADRRLATAARAALGRGADRRARLGDARRPARTSASCATGSASRDARELASARRSGSTSRRSSTCRERMPDPRSRGRSSASPRRSRRSARSLRAARSSSRARTGRWTRSPRAFAGGFRSTCSSRATRLASGCSSGSGARSTPCSSPRRRSGRASTCPARRCRCSSSTSCRSRRPGDPLVEARCERIGGAAETGSRDYSLPAAVLQLRQGFGRLIRSHGDRGVVAILDPRIRTRRYGRAFLESLPPCPRRRGCRRRRGILRRGDRRFRLNGRLAWRRRSPGPPRRLAAFRHRRRARRRARRRPASRSATSA